MRNEEYRRNCWTGPALTVTGVQKVDVDGAATLSSHSVGSAERDIGAAFVVDEMAPTDGLLQRAASARRPARRFRHDDTKPSADGPGPLLHHHLAAASARKNKKSASLDSLPVPNEMIRRTAWHAQTFKFNYDHSWKYEMLHIFLKCMGTSSHMRIGYKYWLGNYNSIKCTIT